MEFIVKNIQSIVELQLGLPDKGIVCFSGENSNGKSIIFKTLAKIVSGDWEDYETRRALIRDNEEQGTFIVQARKFILIVNLHDERDRCFLQLIRPGGEKITRTFREGGMDKLIEEFGFRTYAKNRLCLQIFETFGLMPFVNTSLTQNGEMVEAMITDSLAEGFVDSFKKFTFPLAKKKKQLLDQKISELSAVKAATVTYDWRAYEEICSRLSKYSKILKALDVLELSKIPIPPKVSIVDMSISIPVKIPFVKAVPVIDIPDKLSTIISDMSELRNGKCPTCGQYLISDNCGGVQDVGV